MRGRNRTTAGWVLVMVVFLAGIASAQVRSGAQAPSFELQDAAGQTHRLADLLQSGPLVIWFADVGGDISRPLAQLAKSAQDNGVRLLLIPVVGPDRTAVTQLAQEHPEILVLHDADGRVTEAYTGQFVVGVAPSNNLFVLLSSGRVRTVRFYPGIPPRVLEALLQVGE